MKNLTKPKAVLFDWDGTLVDSLGLILAGNNHLRKEFGLPLFSMQEHLTTMHLGTALDMFRHLYPGREQEALDIYYTYMVKARADGLMMADGAEDLMQFLKAHNIPLGVVSNMKHDPLQNEIKRVGWSHYYQTIIGADASRRGKPHPDPILLGIEEMGLAPHDDTSHIWYVGDMETDVQAAHAAGCRSILIQPFENNHLAVAADMTVSGCRDFLNYMQVIINDAPK